MAMAAPRLAEITLDDKYAREEGQIFLSGTQALVRLLLEQRRRDVREGLNTAGYVSGYRGSPMGTFDTELNRARHFLDEHHIRFRPGVNEDLAATSVWGTQQVPTLADARYDGVFALWYGKGPGVDRSGDALKHGNMAGTSKHGGVLVAYGDDHGAKSSTVAHQSEYALVAAFIPTLNPANVQDMLDFGLAGWAMSRFAGLWVGLKGVNETLLSAATVHVHPSEPHFRVPEGFASANGLLNLDTRSRDDTRGKRYPVEREQRLIRLSLPAAQAFARANGIDRLAMGAPKGRLGIVTTGKAHLDVIQALAMLGIDSHRAGALGLGIYKIGLSWPVEPEGIGAFARGFEEILVVEEKRPLIEDQIAKILYHLEAASRPRIVGKTNEAGAPLLPADESLDSVRVADAILARFKRLGIEQADFAERREKITSHQSGRSATATPLVRAPYFCSGCPHNTSTRVPGGSLALSGIGCHTLAYTMADRPTSLPTQMGGEGGTWIGMAPFVETPHVFQNLGDGTYHHSGGPIIRAAVASGVNITFKILFNDAVAMTGGQPVDGVQTVPGITRQVAAEGVAKIVVVTDEPDKYPLNAGFADGVTIRHRDEMDRVQRELRELPGVSVLIYDQTCAAEKRRRRRRGLFPDPPKRVFINDAVCEGCGDCNVQSNCVSVQPLETEFGRKRRIDQSSCNKDFSCIKGFCPSFVTVHGGALRKASARKSPDALTSGDLPEPALPGLAGPYGILITGIGGAGVVTVGAVLATAAHMEGKAASVYDMTGLAQKNGAVMSHLTLAPTPHGLDAATIGKGLADLLLGCDLVVSRSREAMATIGKGRTHGVVNSYMLPTAAFQQNIDLAFPADALVADITQAVGEDRAYFADATGLATAMFGDSITANFFMVGFAYQLGRVPVSAYAIEAAITLNGLSVATNIAAFRWGRMAAVDPTRVEKAAGLKTEEAAPQSLEELTSRRHGDLVTYQNAAYADRYARLVTVARNAEGGLGSTEFSEAVARYFYKLMAYKDEYEVARLHTDGAFNAKLRQQFTGRYKLRFHLAPPLLAPRDPATGRLIKREYGAWILPLLKLLARLKALRGTWFDPFGHTEERRTERTLIDEYEALITDLSASLTPGNHALVVELAALPERIRGYGHVKAKSVAEVKKRRDTLLAMLRERAALTEAAA
jgi:indolepyruvate ferredoxin oxidoreductase